MGHVLKLNAACHESPPSSLKPTPSLSPQARTRFGSCGLTSSEEGHPPQLGSYNCSHRNRTRLAARTAPVVQKTARKMTPRFHQPR